ncbi:MAG TPA: hypothetical protein VJM46_04845 [Candidatus Saccharimonadales bacterium]|nr:hypothetical protein [Candidatus Saccharimonadales bacterium]
MPRFYHTLARLIALWGKEWFNSGTMSEATPHSSNSKQTRIVIGAILAIIALAYGIPFFMPDGAERYTGEARKAAEAQLKDQQHLPLMDTIFKFEFTLKERVENVYRTPDDTARSWCGSAYKPGGIYYSVELSRRTFFGIETSRGTAHDACILL